jgi:hypothetical protein
MMTHQTVTQLRGLRLDGMARAFEEQLTQPAATGLAFEERFALLVGFFGRLKTELFYPREWRSTTIEQSTQALDSYIRWYNEKRIKISLGSLSPREYRESLGIAA